MFDVRCSMLDVGCSMFDVHISPCSASVAETQSAPFTVPMKSLNDLTIQLYADGADKAGILDLYAKPYIKGLTTNPSLMKKVGIKDYESFAKDVLQTVTAKPISLEVFTDDLVEMKRQALKITAWGKNVYTKIPITNSRGDSCLPLIKELGQSGE